MANIKIQNESVGMKTNSHDKPSYEAEIVFNTPETIETDRIKSVTLVLDGDCRSDMTFDHVESEINEQFQEYYGDSEIVNIKRVEIVEKKTIKRRPFGSYEY